MVIPLKKNKTVYIANFVNNVIKPLYIWMMIIVDESVLFHDDTVHGWVQHKFFGQDVFLKSGP